MGLNFEITFISEKEVVNRDFYHVLELYCNTGNSDKKYGGMHEDTSVTVQRNKAKLWGFPVLVAKQTKVLHHH